MRIAITLVIEMSDEQRERYAAEFGLPHDGGPLRAKDIVADVRNAVLSDIQGGTTGEFADVSIKER